MEDIGGNLVQEGLQPSREIQNMKLDPEELRTIAVNVQKNLKSASTVQNYTFSDKIIQTHIKQMEDYCLEKASKGLLTLKYNMSVLELSEGELKNSNKLPPDELLELLIQVSASFKLKHPHFKVFRDHGRKIITCDWSGKRKC